MATHNLTLNDLLLLKKRREQRYGPIYGPRPSPYNPYFPLIIEISPEAQIIVDIIEEKGFLDNISNKNDFAEQIKQEILKRIR